MKRRRLDSSVRLRLFWHHVLKGYVSEEGWALGEGDALRPWVEGDRMKEGAE
jgi:hypothetical protein